MNNTVKAKFLSLLSFVIFTSCFPQNSFKKAVGIKDSIVDYYNQKKYKEAEKLTTEYVAYNPYDSEVIYLQGQIAYYLKQWPKAIDRFEKSIVNGYNITESKYNIACCYALKGDFEKAYHWLREATDKHSSFYYQWMEDIDLKELANNPNYLNKLYHYNRQEKNRNSKWKADIDFFNERMQKFHYNLFQHITEQVWTDKIMELENKIDSIEDYQIVVELMKLTALVGDGHTVVVPPVNGENAFHLSPFLTYLFDDGLYIIEAHSTYKQLLGTKILAMDKVPISEVIDSVQRVISHDNQFGVKWLLPLAISIAEIPNALGITSTKLEYNITVEKDGKPATYRINCNQKLTGDFLESWLYGFHTMKDWVKVLQEKTPSYQTKTEVPYWFEYLQEDGLAVFHYNQVQTNPDENEEQFIQKLNEFIETNKVKALIIDLRSNEGGDNTIYKPILNGIIANGMINRKGKLFVLIGRRTFSAGMCFATALERYTNAIFVGEPTGSSPNFVGESGGVFQLPYSGIYANASNLSWQNSYAFDNRKYISPQITVEPNYEDFAKGTDRPLEIIKEFINN